MSFRVPKVCFILVEEMYRAAQKLTEHKIPFKPLKEKTRKGIFRGTGFICLFWYCN